MRGQISSSLRRFCYKISHQLVQTTGFSKQRISKFNTCKSPLLPPVVSFLGLPIFRLQFPRLPRHSLSWILKRSTPTSGTALQREHVLSVLFVADTACSSRSLQFRQAAGSALSPFLFGQGIPRSLHSVHLPTHLILCS